MHYRPAEILVLALSDKGICTVSYVIILDIRLKVSPNGKRWPRKSQRIACRPRLGGGAEIRNPELSALGAAWKKFQSLTQKSGQATARYNPDKTAKWRPDKSSIFRISSFLL